MTARAPSTGNSTLSRSRSPSVSRTLFGRVTWPFEFIFAVESINVLACSEEYG